MAALYIGNNNQSKKVKKFYIGVNGETKKVKKAYVGVNGQAKLFYKSNVLPNEYQGVEYIQNSNINSYINPGITQLDNNTSIFYDLSIIQWRGSENLYGPFKYPISLAQFKKGSTSSNLFGLVSPSSGIMDFLIPSNNIYYDSGSETVYCDKVASISYTLNTRHTYTFNINDTGNNRKFLYDNNQVGQSDNTYSYTGTSSVPLRLFGLYVYSEHYYGGVEMSLYHFSVSQNNILVRDMYPCYHKTNNTIGMYDIINDDFYTNAGSGIFTKGPDIDI